VRKDIPREDHRTTTDRPQLGKLRPPLARHDRPSVASPWLTRGLVHKKVEVVNYPDGRFAVQFNGATLGFKVFDKIQTVQPGAIVDNKRLSAVLEQIKAQQASYPARQQRGHVARQRPPNNLKAPSLPSKGRASRQADDAAPAAALHRL
jgi:hypothetical protein